MAISRSLMNRQLRADGGIMQVTPREKFGLGSKLKKFVRKIIPNEVADIAVKAAPFVAPFNPAVAAAMSGLGTFDQTGSIGQSLKGGALTYGLGQGARYLGGAGFQGNPFSADGGAFRGGLEGFKSGFSSPLGNQTGFKLGKPVEAVEGVGVTSEGSYLPFQGEEMNIPSYSEQLDIIQKASPNQMTITESIQKILSPNTTINEKGGEALNLLKRGTKAAFTKSDGKGGTMIDKAAVIGAVTFATSYAEAKALANDAGVDLTEEEYNQALADDKKAEYAGYLENFFAGKKDGGRIGFNDGSDPGDIVLASDSDSELIKAGKFSRVVRLLMDEGFDFAEAVKEAMRQGYNQGGRIGFESGANEMIKTQLLEEIMPDTSTEDMIMIMTEDGPKMIKRSDFEAMPGMFRDTTTSAYGDAGRGRPVPEFANGGRIGYAFGSKPKDAEVGIMTIDVEAGDDDDMEDMDMDMAMAFPKTIFSSSEISRLFSDRSLTTNLDRKQLYKVLMNPGMFPEGEKMLIKMLRGKADGGRIGFNQGSKSIGNTVFGDISQMDVGDTTKSLIKMFSPSEIMRVLSEAGEGFKQIYFNLKSDSEKENLLKTLMGDDYEQKAKGGRIGYKGGANRVSELLILRDELIGKGEDVSDIEAEIFQLTGKTFRSVGGLSDIPTGKMRKNNAGVVERDYRDEGGFVPVGIKERADDVPAMLSKNEFVMTADAVRGIGNGSVEEGSKKLYNTMKQAEKVGKA